MTSAQVRTQPTVSVVIAVDRRRERGAESLRSVLDQDGLEGCEIIVFDFGAKDFPPLAGSDSPYVRVVAMRRGWTYGAFRALAAGLATGDIVAYSEEHSRALPGWLTAIRGAFGEKVAGVSGPPAPITKGTAVGDAYFPLAYSSFFGITDRRDLDLLPGQNSAYSRKVLLSLGRRLPDLMKVESLIDYHLVREGWRLVFDPGIQWVHLSEAKLSELMYGYYTLNRTIGAELPGVLGWSHAVWLLRLLRLPLQPAARSVKMLAAMRSDPEAARRLVVVSPLALAVLCASALGQMIGMLFGEGHAGATFFDREMNQLR
jgi:hypothetical protein